MTPQTVRYGRGLAIVEVVVGALLLLTSVLSPGWLGLFAGAVLLLVGALMLVNPMLKIDANEVRLVSPLGITTRRYPVSSPTDLQIDDKALRHVPSGKKVASLGFGVHAPDVERLRAQLTTPTA